MMTSIAFIILGLVPPVFAHGAAQISRRDIDIGIFRHACREHDRGLSDADALCRLSKSARAGIPIDPESQEHAARHQKAGE